MNELKQLRKQSQLTQVEAAKMCGVSRRTFQTYEEKGDINCTYDDLVKMLQEMSNHPLILPLRYIKEKASAILAKYEDVRCAFLFGSYARQEATSKSDVDILIVAEPMGLNFYGLAADLEEALGKQVDLLSHRQITDNEDFLARLLTEGIKIYENRSKQTKS